MADRYDPSRAKPETMAALCEAVSQAQLEGRRDFVMPTYLCLALGAYRSECRIPLRTRAERDAEIVDVATEYAAILAVRPIDMNLCCALRDRLCALCAEPTAEPEAAALRERLRRCRLAVRACDFGEVSPAAMAETIERETRGL